MNTLVRAFAGVALVGSMGAALAQSPAGTFSNVRNAKHGPSPSSLADARVGDPVRVGELVRTGRRARAEITFSDRSILRINEQTDVVIRDTAEMRTMSLNQGTVWMRVMRGSNASIATPVATATVRGTEFEFTAEGDLAVYEGVVELSGGGETLLVRQGEKAGIGPDGKPYRRLSSRDLEEMPAGPSWLGQFESRGGGGGELVPIVAILGTGGAYFVTNFSDGGFQPSVVPEPATMLVLGAGALLVARRRRPNRP
ncbi:MAG: FecR domain-containing protein [Fimbriimonadaceae bacterium]